MPALIAGVGFRHTISAKRCVFCQRLKQVGAALTLCHDGCLSELGSSFYELEPEIPFLSL